jgi:hypothetical protein
MLVDELLQLWRSDEYDLDLNFKYHMHGSVWSLYTTQFKYQPYEYRRHYGILIESKNDNVIRSRILEFSSNETLQDMIHYGEMIMEMNWKNPD